jgi:hypothetical protein
MQGHARACPYFHFTEYPPPSNNPVTLESGCPAVLYVLGSQVAVKIKCVKTCSPVLREELPA